MTKMTDQRTTRAPAGRSKTDEAFAVIEEMVITLQLEPGQIVSELGIAERIGQGRTPVREALHRLEQAGLVSIMPRLGIIVSEIDVVAQLRMLEVRREVERLLARSAAQRASVAQRERFGKLVEEFAASGGTNDAVEFMRVDREFNQLVVSAARNEFAEKAINLMSGLSRRFFYAYSETLKDLDEAARLHVDVARAIQQGDPPAAAEASDRLMDFIERLTRSSLDI